MNTKSHKSDYIWIFLHLPKTGGTTFMTHLEKKFKYDDEFIHIGRWGDDFRKKNNRVPFEKRSINERSKAIVIAGHAAYYGIHKLVPNKKPRYIVFLRDPGSWMVSTYNYHLALEPNMSKSFDEFSHWYYNYNTRYIQEFMRPKYIRDLEKSGSLYTIKRRLEKLSKLLRIHFLYEYFFIRGNVFQYWRAKRLLNKCFFVGILDSLNNDLSIIFEFLDVEDDFVSVNVTRKNQFQKIEKSLFTPEVKLNNKVTLNEKIKKDCEANAKYDYKLYLHGKEMNYNFKTNI